MTDTDWNASYLYQQTNNLGHNFAIPIYTDTNANIILPEYIKLLNLNELFNVNTYNPFKSIAEHSDNKYAILALFLSSKIIHSILCKENTNEQLDALLSGEFCTKYIKTIMAYIGITQIERPELNFRMYLDFYSYTFLNRYIITKDLFADIFLTPTNYIFLNSENDNIKTYRLVECLNKTKNIIKSFSNNEYRLGTLMVTAFVYMFDGNDLARRNNIEVMLYNLGALDSKYIKVYIKNNSPTYVHTDGGFIGSVVRTFPLRQSKFYFNNIERQRPTFVMIRDAHNCPSSSDFDLFIKDTYSTANHTQYDWVHNVYYKVWWHSRKAHDITDTNDLRFTRGPIFYYINAREKSREDLCIMSNDEWNNTFGKVFLMFLSISNNIYKLEQDFDPYYKLKNYQVIRSNAGAHYRPGDAPEGNSSGFNYGIDEFLSTFCVYDIDDNPQRMNLVFKNSRWKQMFFSFDVFLFNNITYQNEAEIFGILTSAYIQQHLNNDYTGCVTFKEIIEYIQTLRYYKDRFICTQVKGYAIAQTDIDSSKYPFYSQEIYNKLITHYATTDNKEVTMNLCKEFGIYGKQNIKIYYLEFFLIDYFPKLEQILNIVSWARDTITSLYNYIKLSDIIHNKISTYNKITKLLKDNDEYTIQYLNQLTTRKPSNIKDILDIYGITSGGKTRIRKGGYNTRVDSTLSRQIFNLPLQLNVKDKGVKFMNPMMSDKKNLKLIYSMGQHGKNDIYPEINKEIKQFKYEVKASNPKLSDIIRSRTFLKQYSFYTQSMVETHEKYIHQIIQQEFATFKEEYNKRINENFTSCYGDGNVENFYINENHLYNTLVAQFLSTVSFVKEMDLNTYPSYETSMSQLYISQLLATLFPNPKEYKVVTLTDVIHIITIITRDPIPDKSGGRRSRKTKK